MLYSKNLHPVLWTGIKQSNGKNVKDSRSAIVIILFLGRVQNFLNCNLCLTSFFNVSLVLNKCRVLFARSCPTAFDLRCRAEVNQDQGMPLDTVRGHHALKPTPHAWFFQLTKNPSVKDVLLSQPFPYFWVGFEETLLLKACKNLKMLFEQTVLPFLFT